MSRYPTPSEPLTVPPLGAKIFVEGEKRPYTVKARNDAFAVCTKPFNPQRTVLYFILDAKRGMRGPENLIFGMGAETVQDCEEMLERLSREDDPTEPSYRHSVEWTPNSIRVVLPTQPPSSEKTLNA